jgi:hypothetical protein
MSETAEPKLRLGDESVDGWVEYAQRLLTFHGENCGAVDGSCLSCAAPFPALTVRSAIA